MSLMLRRTVPALALALCACASPAPAPPGPPPGQAQAPPQRPYEGGDPEIRQTVARIASIAGEVSFSRGDDPDTWQPADLNVPMTLGDRVWTGDGGRLELQVHGGNVARLSSRTDLQALNLTDAVKQFSLSLGTASFTIRRLVDNEVFEVDTPNSAITLERPGEYRVDVNGDGDSRIQVRRGRAIAAAGGGQVALSAGDEMDIDGIDAPRYDVVALPAPDGWDRWVEERDQRLVRARSYDYVAADVAGVEDLDQYGRWRQIPEHGWVWSPLSVEAGWVPYRAGRWIWQDPWGWTWVSAEPWGWAPYHYGRWVFWSSAWYWVPVAPAVRVAAYSPALVAFVGGSGGYVGWFPLAPRDPYFPSWRRGPTVNVTNVTYVNRTYVTVVNQTTFVSGGSVTRDYVRDRTAIRSIESAPVLRGAVPVVPTRESIRMASREAPAPRPPAAVVSRSVVTRVAPPPSPPRFDAKVAIIRDNRGAPVNAAEASRLSTQDRARTVERSRPVAGESGNVTLAPKNENSRAARPEPIAPVRGRPTLPTPIREERAQPPAQMPERAKDRPLPTPVREERAQPPAQMPERAKDRPLPTPIREERAQPPAQIPERAKGRPLPTPAERPSGISRPPERPRPTPSPEVQPRTERAPRPTPVQRVQAPPPVRERPQPAERIAPEKKPVGRERAAPKPTPTKPAKKEEQKEGENKNNG